jgi:RNA polymerase sigma-70 factor, ECF subfamily
VTLSADAGAAASTKLEHAIAARPSAPVRCRSRLTFLYMMSSIDAIRRPLATSDWLADAGQAPSLEDAKTLARNYNPAVPAQAPGDLTGLLRSWRSGDPEALARLMPLVYSHLRAQARRCLRREAAAASLQSTALVHELYMRLRTTPDVEWHDRAHFFALSARIMRRILVDAARVRAAAKRGGGARASSTDLDEFAGPDAEPATMLCALGDALECLAKVDPRRAQVIELRFFGGFSVAETAELLQVSPQTVMRDWRLARIWLAHELTGEASSGG